MGKVPTRLKEVVYTLSPFQQSVMSGLFKDVPGKLSKKVSENWLDGLFLVVPLVGTYSYANNYVENEKIHHRF